MSDKQQSPKEDRVKKPGVFLRLALVTFVFITIVLAVIAIYLIYFWPSHEYDAKWYDFSFIPTANVTMVILINTTGPQHVTVLNSSSDMVRISMHCVPGPSYYLLKEKENYTVIEYWLNNTFGRESAKVDTFVYLPKGYNYNILLSGKDLFYDSSKIVNKYGRGHLTIWILDGEQHYRVQNYW